ncbi:MAG: hypothetical protein ACKOCH_11940 [Bacteroidota bacterium]
MRKSDQKTTEEVNAEARRAAALSKVQSKSGSRTGEAPAAPTAKGKGGKDPVTQEENTTTMTLNGQNVQRNISRGLGQEGDRLFTPIAELFFVQFAVYCKDTPVDKAPPVEGLMLVWHEGTFCPEGEEGACYIVKGFESAEKAKAAALQFRENGIDCWYNPALTGAQVEVIGVR